jgi:hypothetical protein
MMKADCCVALTVFYYRVQEHKDSAAPQTVLVFVPFD